MILFIALFLSSFLFASEEAATAYADLSLKEITALESKWAVDNHISEEAATRDLLKIMHPLFVKRGAQNLEPWAFFLFEKNYFYKEPSKMERSDAPLIPKIIHQIWIGPKPVPERVKWMMATWKELNPTWEYKLWTNEDLKDFHLETQAAFDALDNWGAKSDLWRCEILDRFGGVYVDIDFECLKPLDELHHRYDFYCGILDEMYIANGLMASRPNHPIMKACIEKWKEISFFPQKDADLIMSVTGPLIFTNMIAEHLTKEENFGDKAIVFPQRYFFPLPRDLRFQFWDKKLQKKEIATYITADSYGLHYWASTWQESP